MALSLEVRCAGLFFAKNTGMNKFSVLIALCINFRRFYWYFFWGQQ